MELRTYPRFPTRCAVYFSGKDTEGDGQLINMSLGGCAVESTVSVERGAFLQLEVNLADQEPPLVIALTPVRWSEGRRFGVEFIGIDADHQQRVRQHVNALASIRSQPSRTRRAKRAPQQ